MLIVTLCFLHMLSNIKHCFYHYERMTYKTLATEGKHAEYAELRDENVFHTTIAAQHVTTVQSDTIGSC